jgi:hypothetical protein
MFFDVLLPIRCHGRHLYDDAFFVMLCEWNRVAMLNGVEDQPPIT